MKKNENQRDFCGSIGAGIDPRPGPGECLIDRLNIIFCCGYFLLDYAVGKNQDSIEMIEKGIARRFLVPSLGKCPQL
jgi:hypothetical protein